MPPYNPLSIDWSGKSNSIFVFVIEIFGIVIEENTPSVMHMNYYRNIEYFCK
jgi:hypothetical protein